MNAEERNLIAALFDRMRSFGAPEKDREAEAFIGQSMRAIPDSGYMLVQSVLVQEHALQQADQRIQELEARVQDLEAQMQPRQQAPASGGFLGGIFGGRSAQPAPQPMSRASVPSMGRPQPTNYNQAPPSGPWAQSSQQGGYAQQQPAPGPMQQQRSGGGFLKTAMATAAGVAGGMILADSLKGMMGGGSASAAGTQSANNDFHLQRRRQQRSGRHLRPE